MTCKNCVNWKILPTHNSERGDKGMEDLGYKNCAADKSKFYEKRFLHGNAKKCEKYVAIKNDSSI